LCDAAVQVAHAAHQITSTTDTFQKKEAEKKRIGVKHLFRYVHRLYVHWGAMRSEVGFSARWDNHPLAVKRQAGLDLAGVNPPYPYPPMTPHAPGAGPW
jgi:hypothetical protein